MGLAEWTQTRYILFFLVFARISGLLQTAPLFQSRTLPTYIRAGISLLVSLILSSLLELSVEVTTLAFLLVLVIQELIIGLAMGYFLNLSFAAIQLAGHMIEMPMGFRMVNIIDPQLGIQMPIISQLQHMLALWLFLLVDGHHLILQLLVRSYRLLPIGVAPNLNQGMTLLVKAFSGIFLMGFQIAIPVWGVILLTDVGLGVLSKLIPQINVFIMGFPIKIVLGLSLIILSLPVMARWISQYFSSSGKIWVEALRFITLLGRGQ